MKIWAASTGAPLRASATVPVIVPVSCASAGREVASTSRAVRDMVETSETARRTHRDLPFWGSNIVSFISSPWV